jgi:hypothetical protein
MITYINLTKRDIDTLNANLVDLGECMKVLLQNYNELSEDVLAIRNRMLELQEAVEAVLVVNMPNDVAEIEGTE